MKEFVDFKNCNDVEDALRSFRLLLEENNIVDSFENWVSDDDFVIVVGNDSIGIIEPYELETFRSFNYSTFTPNFYPDYSDLEYDLSQDLKNRCKN